MRLCPVFLRFLVGFLIGTFLVFVGLLIGNSFVEPIPAFSSGSLIDQTAAKLPEWLVALGTMVLAITAIWGERIRTHFRAPELFIDTTETGLRYSLMEMSDSLSWIVNIRVKPRKWKGMPATECRVLLWETIRNGNASHVVHPFYWTPKSTEPLTHRIGELGWEFAIGRLTKSNNVFDPSKFLVSTPLNFDGMVNAGECLTLGLRIFSDVFESNASERIQVYWDGTWSDNESEIRKHLTFTKVNHVSHQ